MEPICKECSMGLHTTCTSKGCGCTKGYHMSRTLPHKDEVEEWEIEFEQKFPLVGTDERDFDGQAVRDEIKSFIKTLLSHREESLRERILKLNCHSHGAKTEDGKIPAAILVSDLLALLSDK